MDAAGFEVNLRFDDEYYEELVWNEFLRSLHGFYVMIGNWLLGIVELK